MLAKRTPSRKSGGRRVPLAAGLSLSGRDPFALRPAVTGGLPFAEILAACLARTVPSCKVCHSNCGPGDIGEVLYCFLQVRPQNASQKFELRRRHDAKALEW